MKSEQPYLGHYPEAELVFGLVCPLGTEHKNLVGTMQNYLQQFTYRVNHIKLSDLFEELYSKLGKAWHPPTDPAELALYKINAGNTIRTATASEDFLALFAASLTADKRIELDSKKESGPLPRTAHIITTLKRPEEVTTLRRIYGSGFFLIGLSPSKQHRDQYFRERGIENAAKLIETDRAESNDFGQLTSETFHLADVFVPTDDYDQHISRFLDLVFGCPSITPSTEENAMFMAYSASLRSGDLSRQVGAAIVDSTGDLLSVGYNEVPKLGGGLYGPENGSMRTSS